MPMQRSTRVLIAGGSVAGLSLANTLEQLGIDYLVLEKYKKIAPDLGASIGIFPNGFRILDQLGCYDSIKDLVKGADAFKTLSMRDEHAKVISNVEDASTHFTKRVGYEPIFVDRQMIIQILYDNLRDKSKVLTSKGVSTVEHTAGGVEVTTGDGEKILGDILIGADGIHSTVRREMWRLADEDTPGYFPVSERTDAPTEYCCIFGISRPTDGFPKYTSQNVVGQDYSYLVATGPNHRIYWFLFKKLPNIVNGLYEKIPRYTEAQRDELAAEHASDPITDTLTFGDLYAKRTTATLQALPEIVFKKWHYKRIMTIGDAAHKFNPIGGQGGNSAIEDAAVLANQLYKLFDSEKKTANFTDANILEAFQTTQRIRFDRASYFCRKSHEMQSLQAMDSLPTKFIAKYVIPRSSPYVVVEMLSSDALGAARVEALPLPVRPHCDLWDDERPSKPISSSVVRYVGSIAFASLAYFARGSIQKLASQTSIQSTGFQIVDTVFNKLGLGLTNPLALSGSSQAVLPAYILPFLTPILAIWYIEGSRFGSQGSLVSRPSIFALATNVLGAGFATPISFLASIWSTNSASYTAAVGRHVPHTTAKAILPAIALGYVVPTGLLLAPSLPEAWRAGIVTAWRFNGLLVSGLLALLSRASAKQEEVEASVNMELVDLYSNADLKHLRDLYKTAFGVSSLLHGLSLFAMFKFTKYFAVSWDQDTWFAFLAAFVYGIYTTYELRGRGLVTTKQALIASARFVGAQGIVGPGASLLGLWWWREEVLAASTIKAAEEKGEKQ